MLLGVNACIYLSSSNLQLMALKSFKYMQCSVMKVSSCPNINISLKAIQRVRNSIGISGIKLLLKFRI